MSFVSIRDLRVAFDGVEVLHGIDLDIARGEAVGLVGESGCGKSVTWLAALGLLPGKARVSGSVSIDGQELVGARPQILERVRGARIAMIFQDPSSSLNPVHRIGKQIAESLARHRGLRGQAARDETIRLLDLVGIPSAKTRVNLYPHELSGGQCQRIMIAMALAAQPELLIADEPTTALDATIQAQILELLNEIRRETSMALVLISHDLGAVSAVCSRAAVMYAGRVVETNAIGPLFDHPAHPYTRGLFDAIPLLDGPRAPLIPIHGTVPDPRDPPPGCAFGPRCTRVSALCTQRVPPLQSQSTCPRMAGGLAACFHPIGAKSANPAADRICADRVPA